MIITIDGPAASGKSSTAKELCNRLHMMHIKTGLFYRAIAYILVEEFDKNITTDTPLDLTMDDLVFIKDIDYIFKENKPHILYKKNDITEQLSYASIDQIASIVSSNALVRQLLIDVQRELGKKYNLIADGRDCGSVVFPNADYKFYLTATLEARAKRVISDPLRKYNTQNLQEVQNIIETRDKRDQKRGVAPLKIPNDAIIIDNSELTFEQTIQEFLKNIKV